MKTAAKTGAGTLSLAVRKNKLGTSSESSFRECASERQGSMRVRAGAGVRLRWSGIPALPFPAASPWASYLVPLGLSPPICKVGITPCLIKSVGKLRWCRWNLYHVCHVENTKCQWWFISFLKHRCYYINSKLLGDIFFNFFKSRF